MRGLTYPISYKCQEGRCDIYCFERTHENKRKVVCIGIVRYGCCTGKHILNPDALSLPQLEATVDNIDFTFSMSLHSCGTRFALETTTRSRPVL